MFLMILRALIPLAVLVVGCSANAKSEPESKVMTQAECDMRLDFSDASEVSKWRTVLDGVMGGRSSGTRFAEDGHMVFRGTINTNGGGFASIRRDMRPGDMAGAESVQMRVLPDGRDYKLTLRTSERFRGRPVSYQVPIPTGTVGEWREVEVDLSEPRTSVFGRRVPAALLDVADVREMGIILADGVDGPFRLEVAWIGCTKG